MIDGQTLTILWRLSNVATRKATACSPRRWRPGSGPAARDGGRRPSSTCRCGCCCSGPGPGRDSAARWSPDRRRAGTALPVNAGSDGGGATEGMGEAEAEVAWYSSQTSTAAPASAIRIPASSRSGRSPPCPTGASGSAARTSASRSRAASRPACGTSMSRGPAARKSGTSKPRIRRWTLGIPSSSSMPWISSASARLRAQATFTSWPPVYWGLTLRALPCASVIGSCSP